MTLTERIKKVQSYAGLSMLEFERTLGIGRDRISSVIRRGFDKYSSDVLVAILVAHKEISADWLVLGVGEMFRTGEEIAAINIVGEPEETQKPATEPSSDVYKQLYEDYKAMLSDKDERIKALEKLLEEKDKSYVELVNLMTERLNQKDEHIEESSKEYQRTIRQLADRSTRAPFPYGSGSGTNGYGVAESGSKINS